MQEKNSQPEKWKLTEIIVCYNNEYATDITHILNKTISQEASLNQSLHFRFIRNHDSLDFWRIFALQVRKLWGEIRLSLAQI